MNSTRNIVIAAIAGALACGIASPAASAHFANSISQAQAYGVADRYAEAAYNAHAWAEEWGDECSRETPWTFSCSIEIWSNESGGADCWRYFDVASSAWTGRLRTEGWEPWACDPWP